MLFFFRCEELLGSRYKILGKLDPCYTNIYTDLHIAHSNITGIFPTSFPGPLMRDTGNEVGIFLGRRGGLKVSVHDSGSSGPG